jgi:membrane fusion protein, multidrug efflux system
VTAWDRSNTHQLASGTLQSIDSEIDPTTGTIRLKAAFPNSDENLFPQQFVNAVLLLDTLHDATLISQAAIQRGEPGTFVYVVDPSNQTVSVRKVVLGPGDPNNVSIKSGLKPGEMVVIDGADKLKEGAQVQVRQANAPPAATRSSATPGSATPGSGQHHGQGTHGSGQGGHHRQQQQPPQQSTPGN